MNSKVLGLFASGSLALLLAACGDNQSTADNQVIIYSNADDEAIEIMENVLDSNGYEDQYVIQSFGTSELGGKMLAEGTSIEADIVTMASYYIDSAQAEHNMFIDLSAEASTLDTVSSYQLPVLGNVGSIFVNTQVIADKGLAMPKSIKDLIDPQYKDLIAIPNILDSSTGWLLVQAIIGEYGEEEGKQVFADLIKNVGPHLESSGSGPIKKVQTGEVAVGFGLRAQAVDANEEGLPIEYIDPTEGNFALVESIAVIDQEVEEEEKKAKEMAELIAKEARTELIKQYPVALYEGETVSAQDTPAYLKQWESTLTVDLLKEHETFFKNAQTLGGK
ncbi:extracellular solute-binding protein [Lysinibacillus sp. KU-BSD001]|uniref:extracellular solute-binding protein n=1 Tax=Lysinibacillus sp. KU-BSD001 TaxID=3141328 RepID=UPI0036EFF277